jgi:hypothetical protein
MLHDVPDMLPCLSPLSSFVFSPLSLWKTGDGTLVLARTWLLLLLVVLQ